MQIEINIPALQISQEISIPKTMSLAEILALFLSGLMEMNDNFDFITEPLLMDKMQYIIYDLQKNAIELKLYEGQSFFLF